MHHQSSAQKCFLLLLSIAGWAAIVGQFILLIHNRKLSTGATVVQFFSYFTILTNIAVAFYSTISLLAPLSSAGHWIKKASVSAALAVYIVIVGAVYNTILRFLWSPVGLQKIVDYFTQLFLRYFLSTGYCLFGRQVYNGNIFLTG